MMREATDRASHGSVARGFRSRTWHPDAGRAGFSLVELLVIIAILGVLTLITLPSIKGVLEQGNEAKVEQNAKNIARLSERLAAIGVAHVLPESLGGIEATVRLLREGVIVPEGPMQGQRFTLNGISDEEITKASLRLKIVYDESELNLEYASLLP